MLHANGFINEYQQENNLCLLLGVQRVNNIYAYVHLHYLDCNTVLKFKQDHYLKCPAICVMSNNIDIISDYDE